MLILQIICNRFLRQLQIYPLDFMERKLYFRMVCHSYCIDTEMSNNLYIHKNKANRLITEDISR